MPAVTRVGDKDVVHCSLPTRGQGSPNVRVNSRPVSRKGDNNNVHLLPGAPCPAHVAPIKFGSKYVTANGKGIGRVYDTITGCTSVAQGSPNITDGSPEGS